VSAPDANAIRRHALHERSGVHGRWVRGALIALALLFLAVILVAPIVTVFVSAFSKGFAAYFAAFAESEALSAIRLTLITAALVVPLNATFGIAAAWLFAKRRC
jgi:sulfate transport system permease protein